MIFICINLNLNPRSDLSVGELPAGFAVSTTLYCLADTPPRFPDHHFDYDDDDDDDNNVDDDDDDDEFEKDRRTLVWAELFWLWL